VRRACSSDSRFKGLLLASSHRYLYISFALSESKVANESNPACCYTIDTNLIYLGERGGEGGVVNF